MILAARYNIAHRGARSLAPENTMEAFIKARQVGAHGIETDVSVSADGQLLLFHDATLKRTSNVAQLFPSRKDDKLATFDWLELEQLDVGSWFVDTDPFKTIASGQINQDELHQMRGLRIPLLPELLTFIQEKSWFVNIEIKPLPPVMADFPVVETMLELIEEIGLLPNHFSISSFHHPFLQKVQQLRPEIEVNALIGGDAFKTQNWGSYEFAVYNSNVRLTDSKQIQAARHHGCRVNLYTVNDPEKMHYYLSLGVEKIITDYPQLLAGLSLENTCSTSTGEKTV
jgi:glycerophosphoryl diester phosphodiesterase